MMQVRLAIGLIGVWFVSDPDLCCAAELNVGDPAPAFELTGSDGQKYALSDFVGKRAVVIAWYPKAFTGG